ncbi:MAG: hypothetical protein A2Y40_03340 [Candidatus Margulisbacteria bacterium GWF2_35_9]|nr:MAG: hypothetical protein A2Y40_03340 [Candidatus Margulisbacteria bacterium GWF2_35_9]
MKYSFVIPSYNNKKLLKNTLEALNNQTGYSSEDYEVLVVDDGSTDQTKEYIAGINTNYQLNYIYLNRDENSCRSKTRNTGWRNAQGNIIIFIDSDIIIMPNYLLELERVFANNTKCLLIGNRLMLDKNSENLSVSDILNTYQFDSTNYDLLEFRHFLYQASSYNSNAIICPWMQVYSCNLAVPKQYLIQVNGFDENFIKWGMEDIELGYSLYSIGLQIIINSRLEVLHQYHGKRNDLIVELSKEKDYEENIDYFLKKHPEAIKMRRNIAYKFFEGKLPTSLLLLGKPQTKKEITLKDIRDLNSYKKEIEALAIQGDIAPVIYDYLEDTDIDIWIQSLGRTKNIIQYFPMSKEINTNKMKSFIDDERSRQLSEG